MHANMQTSKAVTVKHGASSKVNVPSKKKTDASYDKDHHSSSLNDSQAGNNDGDDDDDDVQWQVITSFEATRQCIQGQSSAMIAEKAMVFIDEAKQEKKLPLKVKKEHPGNGMKKKKNYFTTIIQDEESQMLLLGAMEAFYHKGSANAVKGAYITLKVRH